MCYIYIYYIHIAVLYYDYICMYTCMCIYIPTHTYTPTHTYIEMLYPKTILAVNNQESLPLTGSAF